MRHLSIASPGMLGGGAAFPEIVAESMDADPYVSGLEEQTLPRPPEAQPGDLCVAFVAGRPGGHGDTYTAPNGWERLRWFIEFPQVLAVDWRVMGPSEPAGWTWGKSSINAQLGIRGVFLRHASIAELGDGLAGSDHRHTVVNTESSAATFGVDWPKPKHDALMLTFVHVFRDSTFGTLSPSLSEPAGVTPLTLFERFGSGLRDYTSLFGWQIAPAGWYDPGLYGTPTSAETVRQGYSVSVYPA